jgi:hypothetical protein
MASVATPAPPAARRTWKLRSERLYELDELGHLGRTLRLLLLAHMMCMRFCKQRRHNAEHGWKKQQDADQESDGPL